MTLSNLRIGRKGEQIASEFIAKKGFTLVECNYRTRFGEIDLVAKKADTYAFIEVKTRTGIAKGKPYEAVSRNKIKHMMQSAQFYVLQKKLEKYKLSMQVVSITLGEGGNVKEIDYFDDIPLQI